MRSDDIPLADRPKAAAVRDRDAAISKSGSPLAGYLLVDDCIPVTRTRHKSTSEASHVVLHIDSGATAREERPQPTARCHVEHATGRDRTVMGGDRRADGFGREREPQLFDATAVAVDTA
jgi:hypothetical protein